MDGAMKIGWGSAALRKVVPGSVRAHPFVALLVAGIVVGGGVRYVPTSTAAVPGSSAGAPGSTACAVK